MWMWMFRLVVAILLACCCELVTEQQDIVSLLPLATNEEDSFSNILLSFDRHYLQNEATSRHRDAVMMLPFLASLA